MAEALRREIELSARRLVRLPRQSGSDAPTQRRSGAAPLGRPDNGELQAALRLPISSGRPDFQLPPGDTETSSAAGERDRPQVVANNLQLVPSGANRPGSLLIAVVSCNAYRHRVEAVRKTWGRDAKQIVYVVGRPVRRRNLPATRSIWTAPTATKVSPRSCLRCTDLSAITWTSTGSSNATTIPS